VNGELTPKQPIRVSDDERNQIVDQLNQAVGDGRLTLAEFEERVDGVLAARTQDDLVPFVADLPAALAPQVVTVRAKSSTLKRTGRWAVPRQLVVEAKSANIRLDLTEAQIASPTVEMLLDARSSALTVVLPRGASASLYELDLTSSTTSSKLPDSGGLHVVLRGTLTSSTLKVRYQRRFLRWRW
jgi:DUF1707 SHOCT-like domain